MDQKDDELEILELEALAKAKAAESGQPQEKEPTWSDRGAQALDVAGKVLGYAGGLSRTALANSPGAILMEKLTGLQISNPKDLKRALKGEAPTGAEYLERAGVPQGPSLSDVVPSAYSPSGEEWLKLQKGGWADPSARGAAGLAIDTVTDPLSYVSLGASGAAKGALNPISKGIEKGGEALYKSGFKNIDTRLAEKGLKELSPYALEQGMYGSQKSILSQMEKRLKDLVEERKGLYQKGDLAGAVVSPESASKSAVARLDEMKSMGYGAPERADRLLETLAQHPALDRQTGLSLQKASDVKTSLYDLLPQNAFDANGRMTNEGKQMLKDLSLGYRDEILKAGEAAEPGLGKAINTTNEEMSAYLGALKPTQSELAKDTRKNLLTEVKSALLATSPKSAAAMWAAKGLNSPAFRTTAGYGARQLGQASSGYLDPVLRQIFIENQARQNPWEMLK